MIRSVIFLVACVCSAADFTGAWNLTARAAEREVKAQLVLKDDGGKLAGTMTSEQGSLDLEEVKVSGDELSFKIPYRGGVSFTVKASGNSLKGTFTSAEGTSGTIEAIRGAAAAAAPAAAGPAVTGAWKLVAQPANGTGIPLQLDLNQNGDKVNGTLTAGSGEALPLQDPKLEGSDLTFKVAANGGTYSVKITLSGTSAKGTFTSPDGSTGNIEGGR